MEIYQESGERSGSILLSSRFAIFHPYVQILYYAGLLLFLFLFQNPLFSLALFCAALALVLYYGGRFSFFYLVFGLIILITTPLTQHRGRVILFYFFENPVTLEAVIYGFLSMLLVMTALLFFTSFNRVFTSEKFLYVFSPLAPRTAFVLSMSLRFVPLFIQRGREISEVQKNRRAYCKSRSIKEKIKQRGDVFACLADWSLEEGMLIAQGLKSKAYGIKKRSHYTLYKLIFADFFLIFFEIFAIFLLIFLRFRGLGAYHPYENIRPPALNGADISSFSLLLFFIALPFLTDLFCLLKRKITTTIKASALTRNREIRGFLLPAPSPAPSPAPAPIRQTNKPF